MDLKSILKAIKLNESTISMVLGAIVVATVGILVINYFRDQAKGTTLPGLSTALNVFNKEVEEKEKAGTPGTYKVVKGDSLWKIAQSKYGDGFKWTEIAKANKLANASKIEVGQELTISQLAEKASSQAEKPAQEIKGGSITGATYTVVHGDNLWDIAVRAYGDGFQWTKIARENKLTHPNLIHPGNSLSLPR